MRWCVDVRSLNAAYFFRSIFRYLLHGANDSIFMTIFIESGPHQRIFANKALTIFHIRKRALRFYEYPCIIHRGFHWPKEPIRDRIALGAVSFVMNRSHQSGATAVMKRALFIASLGSHNSDINKALRLQRQITVSFEFKFGAKRSCTCRF